MRVTTVFYMHKTENVLWLNNNNKKKSYEITTKSLKPSLKNLNDKDNEVVQMFIKKKNKNAPITK
jgi:fructose-bisphosphate aldolase class 1